MACLPKEPSNYVRTAHRPIPPSRRGEASAAEPSLLLSLPGASVPSLASACVSWARNSQRDARGY